MIAKEVAKTLRRAKVRLVGKVINRELIVNAAKTARMKSSSVASAKKIVEKYLSGDVEVAFGDRELRKACKVMGYLSPCGGRR